jgi:hypothetical protein
MKGFAGSRVTVDVPRNSSEAALESKSAAERLERRAFASRLPEKNEFELKN